MLNRNSGSDKTILKRVNQRPARASLGSGSRVTATVNSGRVTLSGTIQYENQ